MGTESAITYDNQGYPLPYAKHYVADGSTTDKLAAASRSSVKECVPHASKKQNQSSSPLRGLSLDELCAIPSCCNTDKGSGAKALTDDDWEELSADKNFPEIIAIVGPTASGKTTLADRIAARLGASVLSADSMQIYKGMDIGTAKADPKELEAPLYGVDLVEPTQSYSAQQFQSYGRSFVERERADGRPVLICGGTGLYVNAVCDEMRFPSGEQDENPLRRHFATILEQEGAQKLYELLLERDPESAQELHPNNSRRVMRALEMAEQGISYKEQSSGLHDHTMLYRCAFIGCAWDRERLYERIDKRVCLMFERGLIDEVRRLNEEGVFTSLTASQAIGYKEILESGLLDGVELPENLLVELPSSAASCPELERALAMIQKRSRNYAKRQLTWFYRDRRVQWIKSQDTSSYEQEWQVYRYLRYLCKMRKGV